MAESRRRAREQFGVELEHEVVLLGLTPKGSDPREPTAGRNVAVRTCADRRRPLPAGDRAERAATSAARARAERRRPVPAPSPSEPPRPRSARSRRLARCCLAFALLGGVLLALVVARRDVAVRRARDRGDRGAARRRSVRSSGRSPSRRGESLVGLDLDAATERSRRGARRSPGSRFDRAFPHTLSVTVVPERPVAVVRQGAAAFVVSERGRVVARVRDRSGPSSPGSGSRGTSPLEPGAIVDGELRTAVGAVAPLAGAGSRAGSSRSRPRPEAADAAASLRPRAPARGADATSSSSSPSPGASSRCSAGRLRLPRRQRSRPPRRRPTDPRLSGRG